MLYLLRLIFILSVAFPVVAMAGERENVATALERGRAAAKAIALPSEQDLARGMKAARKAAATYHSAELQARIHGERKRLKKIFGRCTASREVREEQPPVSCLGENERIYLFLSSSMPDETIHNYLLDIERIGEPRLVPVMRGLVKGFSDMKASAQYFSRILKEDPGCRDDPRNRDKICKRFKTGILFQPPLFEKYGIERVPTLVYDNGDRVILIRGDASLAYLLERINREVKEAALKKLIRKLRGS